ncbi:MAG: endo-1,4-beta-xylanase [Prevotella sp.]|nr:endo-1,4-beta-xylanase [Prevotella sp.]
MRKLLQTLFLAAVATAANAQLSTNPDKFLGNITTSGQVDYGKEKFYELWNQITPENESKWDACEPQRGNFNWSGADRAFNYAKQHGFTYKFHTLVWGGQYPGWMNNLSTSEQYKAIVEWFDAAAQHYPDMPMIDVVNEAIAGHAPAPYKEALGGDGKTGYDWIIKAFEMAHERWPNAILIYNDYNTFTWQHEQFIDLVKTLRNAGAPIDAYGCQSHDMMDKSISEIKDAVDNLNNQLKMPMYSTEYDIGTEDDNTQLNYYKNQIPYMWEKDYCAGITLWGYIYGHTWTTGGNSGIIKDGKDRPAMTWLREYMASDKAKKAKSPFPGMKKEASLYVGVNNLKATRGDKVKITVRAKLRTKTIRSIDLYVKGSLVKSFGNASTSTYEYTPASEGEYDIKAVLTATDGSTYERWSGFEAFKPRQAYGNNPVSLPGTIQAENFDEGPEGIAYHDSDNTNEGNTNYRSNSGGVDIVTGNGGYAIGYTNSGEWLEYTVNVKEAGNYSFDATVSSGSTSSSFSLSLNTDDGLKQLTDAIPVPCVTANDWNTYRTVHGRLSIPLEAGKQIIRLNITGSSCNIDKIVFKHINIDNNMNVSISANPSPATVGEATKIKVNASSSSSTVKSVRIYFDNVLQTTLSSPFEYNYTPANKGTYNVSAIAVDANNKESKIVRMTLTVNGKRTPYKGVIAIPGTIEAENFDKGGEGFTYHDSDSQDEGGANYRSDSEGVDVVRGGSGYALGYTAGNEWYEYSVNVTEGGEYSYEAYASSGNDNTAFSLSISNNGSLTKLCDVNVGNTGSWDTYKTITGKLNRNLTMGQQIFRITITGAYCNIDKITLKCTKSGVTTVLMDAQQDNGPVYNLSGQRVGANYKGIVIKNGRKVLNR